MAVTFTYCRPVSHDRAYFADPLKMLGGRIEPPSFNLSNTYMVKKHVHSTIISALHKLTTGNSNLNSEDKQEITEGLHKGFPQFVKEYLFDEDGNVRNTEYDISTFTAIIEKHTTSLNSALVITFQNGWPSLDLEVVSGEALSGHLQNMDSELLQIIKRLQRRLKWALNQLDSLESKRRKRGTLDDYDDALYKRCDRFVKKMKGTGRKRRSEAEGVNDTLTWSVLSIEGFLPGYGLDTGSILGMAEVPPSIKHLRDFDLPRNPAVALREYVPGNLIYANGQKFVPRYYHREFEDTGQDSINFDVDYEKESISEITASGGGTSEGSRITSIEICDVTLLHASRISDDEVSRFQLGVAVFGRELGQHNGGRNYDWGELNMHFIKGNHIQLVNVGAPSVIDRRETIGYPICKVCGQSVSPLASERQLIDFSEKHKEYCGQDPVNVGFHTTLTVDCIKLLNCQDKEVAYSVLEGIRFAASDLLDMEINDLHILVIGKSDTDSFDGFLYDPMPGGSGLLEKILEKFPDVINQAQQIAESCPSLCERSCVDCFQLYRNSFYHDQLNRHILIETIKNYGTVLTELNPIAPSQKQETREEGSRQPAGSSERKLKNLIQAAGLPSGTWNKQIQLRPPLRSTTPDVTFDDPDDDSRKIYIYLDGLSGGIHGNAETMEKDIEIRSYLRNEGHEVIEITAHDLDDPRQLQIHFKKLARYLIGSEGLAKVKDHFDEWFEKRDN